MGAEYGQVTLVIDGRLGIETFTLTFSDYGEAANAVQDIHAAGSSSVLLDTVHGKAMVSCENVIAAVAHNADTPFHLIG